MPSSMLMSSKGLDSHLSLIMQGLHVSISLMLIYATSVTLTQKWTDSWWEWTLIVFPNSQHHFQQWTHWHTRLTHAPSTDSILSDKDPFRFAPTPGEPSMQIQCQVAYYHATLSTKEAKSKALNTFTTTLLEMCPLCWAYQGILVPRQKKRQWIQCRGPLGEGYMQMGIDRPFKKRLNFHTTSFVGDVISYKMSSCQHHIPISD